MKLIIDIPEEKIAIEYGKVVSIGRNNDKELADYIFAGTPLTEPIYNIVIDEDEMMFLKDAITDERLVIEKRLTESDDCVSREAVIELVKKGEYDITGKTDNEMFLEEVNKLPSVQPK